MIRFKNSIFAVSCFILLAHFARADNPDKLYGQGARIFDGSKNHGVLYAANDSPYGERKKMIVVDKAQAPACDSHCQKHGHNWSQEEAQYWKTYDLKKSVDKDASTHRKEGLTALFPTIISGAIGGLSIAVAAGLTVSAPIFPGIATLASGIFSWGSLRIWNPTNGLSVLVLLFGPIVHLALFLGSFFAASSGVLIAAGILSVIEAMIYGSESLDRFSKARKQQDEADAIELPQNKNYEKPDA